MAAKIRKDLVIVCSILVFFSIVVIVFYNVKIGAQKINQQLVRLILTCVFSYYTILNKAWAKWTLGVLSLLGGFLSVFSAVNVFFLSTSVSVWLFIIGSFYIFAGIYVLMTKNIGATDKDEKK